MLMNKVHGPQKYNRRFLSPKQSIIVIQGYLHKVAAADDNEDMKEFLQFISPHDKWVTDDPGYWSELVIRLYGGYGYYSDKDMFNPELAPIDKDSFNTIRISDMKLMQYFIQFVRAQITGSSLIGVIKFLKELAPNACDITTNQIHWDLWQSTITEVLAIEE